MKMQTPVKPKKIHIVETVLMRAFRNVFFLNFSHCVKSYGHLCQIYQNHSPDMVMSRDNGNFSPNSVLNCMKSYHIWGNWLKNKTVTGKNTLGEGGVESTPSSAYRVKQNSA